jgi:TorA maturation chaperone TorD
MSFEADVAMQQPISFSSRDDAEELARAEVYGLLSALFYAPPDEAVHAQLQVAVTEAPSRGGFLERSWTDLVGAARTRTRQQIADEYADLFLGIGRPEVYLYGSYYLGGSLNGKPLVELRRDLAVLGLERPETVAETEDHIASLCEVMRYLIAGDDVAVCQLASQHRFFDAHLRPWVDRLSDALAEHPRAVFYASVAAFTRDFFAVESQAFDLADG